MAACRDQGGELAHVHSARVGVLPREHLISELIPQPLLRSEVVLERAEGGL